MRVPRPRSYFYIKITGVENFNPRKFIGPGDKDITRATTTPAKWITSPLLSLGTRLGPCDHLETSFGDSDFEND